MRAPDSSAPLDEDIISIAMEFQWKGQSVDPRRLRCGEAILPEKIIVDFSEITNMHRQKGGRLLNELFEHLGPWLLPYAGYDRSTGCGRWR